MELKGVRISKPFVEKPAYADDHNIHSGWRLLPPNLRMIELHLAVQQLRVLSGGPWLLDST